MGSGVDQQKLERENMRDQLASAVTSIQWSYAIFWSPSSAQPGELEWGEGYYNGDIKTRRTILAMEMDNDQMGCQRSDQLRELYESLLSGGGGDDNNPPARRPAASLSPEDLTNSEWYYLVCMSFIFGVGQGLPGRSLAKGRPIWLSNAHCADTTIFCRSLLAKSAGIQTVVCFPFLGGVIELGATELVQEDQDLIHHVKTTFLETNSYPNILTQRTNDHDYSFAHFRNEVLHEILPPLMQDEDIGLVSPHSSSKGFGPIQLPNNNAFFVEGLDDEGTSQAQSWYLNDEQLSNCVHNSMTSSDCVSQTLANTENNEAIDCNNPNLLEEEVHYQDPLSEDFHYQSILSSLFKKPHQMVLGVSFDHNLDKGSSFVRWRNKGCHERDIVEFKSGITSPQKMLKGILFEVPRLHERKEDGAITKEVCKNEGNEHNSNHVLAERRRREKVNERFSLLKSLIPSASKAGKISILDDTIAYLKELERKVQALEACQELVENNKKNKRRPHDMEERTSDNYGNDINVGPKNKRKTRDKDVETQEHCNTVSTNKDHSSSGHNTIGVRFIDEDILIEINCPWKESLFLEIIDTLSNLDLDSHSVQSSTVDGIVSLTVKSRVRGRKSLSIGMITQALQRVIKSD